MPENLFGNALRKPLEKKDGEKTVYPAIRRQVREEAQETQEGPAKRVEELRRRTRRIPFTETELGRRFR